MRKIEEMNYMEEEDGNRDELIMFLIECVEKWSFFDNKGDESFGKVNPKVKEEAFEEIAYEIFEYLGIMMISELLQVQKLNKTIFFQMLNNLYLC